MIIFRQQKEVLSIVPDFVLNSTKPVKMKVTLQELIDRPDLAQLASRTHALYLIGCNEKVPSVIFPGLFVDCPKFIYHPERLTENSEHVLCVLLKMNNLKELKIGNVPFLSSILKSVAPTLQRLDIHGILFSSTTPVEKFNLANLRHIGLIRCKGDSFNF